MHVTQSSTVACLMLKSLRLIHFTAVLCVIYLQHVSSGGELDLQQLQGLISKAWVEEEDKGKYEQQAQQEEKAYQVSRALTVERPGEQLI